MRKDQINKLLDQIEAEVKFDSFTLTRDNQDAIDCRLKQLRNFINQTYDEHRPSHD